MVDALRPEWDRSEDGAQDLLLLDSLPGVGPAGVQRLARSFGGAAQARRARFRDFAAIAGVEAARARRRRDLADQVDRALTQAHELGMTVATWGSSWYPDELLHLTDPPPLLFLRGRVELLARRPAVTIVGSRRVTTRGRDVSRTIGRKLAQAGAVVVSGLALGTDGQAHRGALEAGGDTIAVLGAGADVSYPRTHARLHHAMAERGLLVTEFAPGTKAAPYHFPRRNRVLAALGVDGVVVVEAGERSGSLITVDHALDLGRDVWAVPGPIDGPACAGSNQLVADGARALVSIGDFVGTVAEPARGGSHGSSSTRPMEHRPTGTSSEEVVLRSLSKEALPASEVAVRCGQSVSDVLAALTTLELSGRVVRLPGLRYRRAA